MPTIVCCCLVAKLSLTLATPWTIAHKSTLSMGFPRQEHWSGLPFPSSADLPDPQIKANLLHRPADSLPLSHQENPMPTIVAFNFHCKINSRHCW